MKSVAEHLADALAVAWPPRPRDVMLPAAVDCLLAEDVVSPVDLPPFDNSSMDGYAVVFEDVAGAGEASPIVLPVVADLPAGTARQLRLVAGNSARIMTGARLPEGTGAVVPVEWTDSGLTRVEIRRAPELGQYLRRAGGDVRAGEVVMVAGTRLSPRHIALLAALGRDRVRVRPRPRVAIVSTGSELVEPGQPLGPGQIYESNGHGLAAAAADVGAIAHRAAVVRDEPETLMAALEDQLARADLVITSGGVSAGAYDTVKEVLARLGTVRFEKVAMQPGMPQGLGTIGPSATPIFTLPGNPVSSMVSFEVFVRPAIRKMWGETDLHRETVTATVRQGWKSPEGKRQFVRAQLVDDGDGAGIVPVGGQGSHLVADLAQASCLAVVPEDVTTVSPGDTLRCMVLDRARR